MADGGLIQRVRDDQAAATRQIRGNGRSVVIAGACAVLLLVYGEDLLQWVFSGIGLPVERSKTTPLVVGSVFWCGVVLVPSAAALVAYVVIWSKARRILLRVARNPDLAALLVPPMSGQLATLKAVAGHGRAVRRVLVWLVLVALLGTAVVAVADAAGPQAGGAALGLGTLFGLVVLALVIVSVARTRRWRTANYLRRWSENPGLAAKLSPIGPVVAGGVATRIPALTVEFAQPRTRQQGVGPVTTTTNVLNRQPLKIAYLRLFDNQTRTRDFLRGAWREVGYVHLLRSAASVGPAELREARGSGTLQTMFVTSPRAFRQHLERQPDAPLPPGDHRLTSVTDLPLKVRDSYGSYPVRSVLCHGSFWQLAVDLLLARVDLVALDLSGYRPANTGTQFELQRVLDRFPVHRVVLLCDSRSDRAFIEAQIRHHWARMAEGSPNSGSGRRRILVGVTDTSSDYRGPTMAMRGPSEYRRSLTRWLIADALGLGGRAGGRA